MSERDQLRLAFPEDQTLLTIVRGILSARGLEKDAIEWICKDVYPRLSFLDVDICEASEQGALGARFEFSQRITMAFHELLDLEVELYSQKTSLRVQRDA